MCFCVGAGYNHRMTDFHFEIPIEVRYADLDPQGHVNNARYLTYFEHARANYLVKLGLFAKGQSFLDLGVIVADAQVTFVAPIFWGMDVRIAAGVTRLGNKSMSMAYSIRDAASGQVLATGSTTLVTFDYHQERSIPIPDTWREKITEFEGLK